MATNFFLCRFHFRIIFCHNLPFCFPDRLTTLQYV
jgi:hypothetical protein